MRLVAALLVAMGAVTAVGCGGDDRVAWDGPSRPFPVTGTLPVDGFAEDVDAVDEPWERSVVGLATAYALPLVNDASDVHAEFVTSDPDGNAIVAVTLDVLDDSVRELRFVLRFDVITDTSFRVLDAVWLQRCQTGRGHQGWSRVLCV